MAVSSQTNPFEKISRILLIAFLAISLVCMACYVREGDEGVLHRIQGAFHSVFAPVEYLGSLSGSAIDNASDAIDNATTDEETVSALRERVAELTELTTQGEEYRLEVERLQGLLNLKETYEIDGVSARVIGRSFDAWNQTITIDVGSESDVKPGLTVMGPSGVIGQVISSNVGSSTVRLLTDPKSGAAAIIQSSRADGIVRGSLSGVLYLENVDPDVEVNIGDVVLTSGLGGSYTKGLLIGTVVRIDGNAKDGTRQIIVSPNEIANALEEVLVIFSASEDKASAALTQSLSKNMDSAAGANTAASGQGSAGNADSGQGSGGQGDLGAQDGEGR